MQEPDWNQIHRQLSHGISAPEILSHRVFGRQRPIGSGLWKVGSILKKIKWKKAEVCGITLLQSVSIHSISIAKWEGDRLWECTRPARHQAQHSSRRRAALAALPSSCVCVWCSRTILCSGSRDGRFPGKPTGIFPCPSGSPQSLYTSAVWKVSFGTFAVNGRGFNLAVINTLLKYCSFFLKIKDKQFVKSALNWLYFL